MNEEGYYKCECNAGFVGDGFGDSGCANIDECVAEEDVCLDENTYCTDSIGPRFTTIRSIRFANMFEQSRIGCPWIPITGSYHCLCESGYVKIDEVCVNFNECIMERSCNPFTERCIDTTGGYRCVCIEGFHRVDSVCVDIDECELPKPGLGGRP